MKSVLLSVVLIATAFVLPSAAKIEIPACIDKIIDGLNASPRLSPYISLDSYVYRGKMTYLATSGCCDRFNPLFDGECRQICVPSGGFTGRGDGKCVDFAQAARPLGNIWTVPRS